MKVLFILFMALIVSSCNDKYPRKNKPSISTFTEKEKAEIERIKNELYPLKRGFSCELIKEDSSVSEPVFYIQHKSTLTRYSFSHYFYRITNEENFHDINEMGVLFWKVGKNKSLLSALYNFGEEDMYQAKAILSPIIDEEDENKRLISENALIDFDKKLNEFSIEITKTYFDKDDYSLFNDTVEKIKVINCLESEMRIKAYP